MTARSVFFVSDGTGITAESLGHSLLVQFEGLKLRQATIPFVDSPDKVREAVERIRARELEDGAPPIVFSTLVSTEGRDALRGSGALYFDFLDTFIGPLEVAFGRPSTHSIGRSHSASDTTGYTERIEAVNFSMAHDDGGSHANLEQSDVIMVGVSRSGKTPTCLYMALQFGIRAANYPLIPEDLDRGKLPPVLEQYRSKLYGLTISPARLSEIRASRRPNSRYADPANCRDEVERSEQLMRREGIRWTDSTTRSIEEIATTVLRELKIERRAY